MVIFFKMLIWRLKTKNRRPFQFRNDHSKLFLKTSNLIRFAHIYRTPKRDDCYEQRILNITSHSQSLQPNEKSLRTQYWKYPNSRYEKMNKTFGLLCFLLKSTGVNQFFGRLLFLFCLSICWRCCGRTPLPLPLLSIWSLSIVVVIEKPKMIK